MNTDVGRRVPYHEDGHMRALLAVLAIGFGSAVRADDSGPPDPSTGTLVLHRSLLDYEQKTELGSPIYSILQDCLVKPGDRVKAGQILGHLQDGEVRAEVSLRDAEAKSSVEIRLSEARSALASAKLQRTASLLRRNASSQEEYLQHKQEAAAAALEVELAKHKHDIAGLQLKFARAVLDTRSLVSPHAGVVTSVLRRRGESVAPRDPILQIVDPSVIRVVCQVDVSDAWRLKVGQPARVIVEIAGVELEIEQKVFTGTISFIDTAFDPNTRTCKVFVTTPNPRGELRAGLEARVEIDPPGSEINATPAGDPRAAPRIPEALQ